MPQYIPGNESLLVPAFTQIAEGVSNLLQPNRRFQDAVLGAITKDPSLLQSFADYEASAPGTLQKLGIGALAAIPPSPEAEFAAKNRGKIVEGKGTALAADTEKNKLAIERIKGMTKVLTDPNAPQIAKDAALKELTGQTEAERTIKTEEAKRAPGETQLAEATLPGQLQGAALQAKGFEIANKMTKEGAAISFDKIMNGEYKTEELAALATTPYWRVIELQQREEADKRLRKAQESSDSLERWRQSFAAQLFMNTAVGSPEAAYAYLFKGGAQAAAQGKEIPPEQKAIRDKLGVLDERERAGKALMAQQKVLQAVNAFKTIKPGAANDDERRATVEVLNGMLTERALYGGPLVQATFEPKKVGGAMAAILPGSTYISELVYKDASGQTIAEPDAITGALRGAEAQIDPDLLPFVNQYRNLKTPAEQQAALANWRGQSATNPEFVKRLEAALGVKP